ncbi:MAG: tRNA 2-thiouridine(34) synthase MnmA [Gammaproteobacteria bacterium]|nr:tRNA 2-thiouridine(34) synthase MnmA [Gammaproteobacteria bacterium]
MSSDKVIVGLSGGVDSSVAALRLLQQGYQVEALFMKNWEEDDEAGYCAAAEDLADAQAVADLLGIRLHAVNFASEYWDRVFAYFLDEYRAGRTPNPDVLCNREIKFKAFLDHALDLGASHIATGHYADVSCRPEGCELLRAADDNKDQTYFLYMLGQHALRHTLFPLADLEKQAVRELARNAGFPNHKKKDSTGVCFIGERRFSEFLARYLPANPGDIVDTQGTCIGRHNGLMFYTLGQRQGLGIGGVTGAPDEPWYVVDKDLANNRLIVAQGHDHPRLLRNRLSASQVHWISGTAPPDGVSLLARCRHRQPLQACTVAFDDEQLEVAFEQPQRAITPGQSVVLYDGRKCLGGAIID